MERPAQRSPEEGRTMERGPRPPPSHGAPHGREGPPAARAPGVAALYPPRKKIAPPVRPAQYWLLPPQLLADHFAGVARFANSLLTAVDWVHGELTRPAHLSSYDSSLGAHGSIMGPGHGASAWGQVLA